MRVRPQAVKGLGYERSQGNAIGAEVGKAVAKWRSEAALHGLGKAEIERMASAFDHADLERATKKA